MNTPLLERYLTAIKFWLPKAQRDDIAAELGANLHEELDDRAAAAGRPLTDEEIAGILKEHGSPALVASRYQHENPRVTFGRQIIGPLLFPFYWIALKATLALLLIPAIVPALVWNANFNPNREIAHVFYRVAELALPALFVVTIIFALIDLALRRFHLLERWTSDWDPRALPTPSGQKRLVRRSSSIAGIIVQSIFIIWWMGHSSLPIFVFNKSGAHLQFASLWASLHLPVLLIAFVCLAQHWMNLVKPQWRWLPPLTGIITSLAGIIILYPFINSPPLITITDSHGVALYGRQASTIHAALSSAVLGLWFGLMIFAIIYAWRLAWIAWEAFPHQSNDLHRNDTAGI